MAGEELAELLGGSLSADPLRDERGDGLAERVRRDPVQAGPVTDLPPPALHVVDLLPRPVPGREDRTMRVVDGHRAPALEHRYCELWQGDPA